MGRYLDEMANHIGKAAGDEQDEALLTTHFLGQNYSLALSCQARGLRRFVVRMQEPWPQTLVIGRLLPNGRARVFDHGVALFSDYLLHEGLFEEFCRDLKESLALCACGDPKMID
ncbi:MAG: hypothetical protein KKE73_09990 [Proteobacteria bacterium]|nr:hypothetical protein [Pseudomonadota bacterium]